MTPGGLVNSMEIRSGKLLYYLSEVFHWLKILTQNPAVYEVLIASDLLRT